MGIESAIPTTVLKESEDKAAAVVRAYVEAYLYFPTPYNFDLLTEKVRDYQTAWMNGRQRL